MKIYTLFHYTYTNYLELFSITEHVGKAGPCWFSSKSQSWWESTTYAIKRRAESIDLEQVLSKEASTEKFHQV